MSVVGNQVIGNGFVRQRGRRKHRLGSSGLHNGELRALCRCHGRWNRTEGRGRGCFFLRLLGGQYRFPPREVLIFIITSQVVQCEP